MPSESSRRAAASSYSPSSASAFAWSNASAYSVKPLPMFKPLFVINSPSADASDSASVISSMSLKAAFALSSEFWIAGFSSVTWAKADGTVSNNDNTASANMPKWRPFMFILTCLLDLTERFEPFELLVRTKPILKYFLNSTYPAAKTPRIIPTVRKIESFSPETSFVIGLSDIIWEARTSPPISITPDSWGSIRIQLWVPLW